AKDLVRSREGVRNCAYNDSEGKLTIGIGHLVTSGDGYGAGTCLSDAEVEALYDQDFERYYAAAQEQAAALPEPATNSHCMTVALASVNYQLGTGWRSNFTDTWAKMEAGDFCGAADNVAASLWAQQTPVRTADFTC